MVYDSELARRINGRIILRPGGVRVKWSLPDLATADGHRAEAVLSCAIRALPGATDQKMLEEAFLSSRPVVMGADIALHFAGPLEAAAKRHAGTLSAHDLMSDAGRAGLTAALSESARAIAFACGVECLPPIQLDLDSPTLRQEHARQRRSAEQVDDLRRSGELYKQFESIRASAPDLTPGQILQRIGVADQADLLRSLLQTSAGNNRRQLWAVAGSYLIQIPLEHSATPQARLIPVSPALGPIRSVQADQADPESTALLLGCRSGVLRIDPARPDSATAYEDPSINSQLGFNAAVATRDRIWASHGEAGLIYWPIEEPMRPRHIARRDGVGPASFSPRNLVALEPDRLVFSAGGQLMHMTDGDVPDALSSPAAGDVTAIFIQPHRMVTAHEDGLICTRTLNDARADCQQRRSGRITAAAALPWLGDVRLLLATEDGPILCIGTDDELVTQYTSAHRGLRIVAGSADTVAAVTSDRQRLILWHSWDGRKPFAEIHIYGLAKHRVADLAFA